MSSEKERERRKCQQSGYISRLSGGGKGGTISDLTHGGEGLGITLQLGDCPSH